MKKALSLVLVMLLLCISVVSASAMGVQVIGGPAAAAEPVFFNDLKLGQDAEILGWGILTLTEFNTFDEIDYYSVSWDYRTYDSGADAEYVLLYADILNTQLKEKNYLDDVSVIAVYNDIYEYSGWSYQRDFNQYYPNRPIDESNEFPVGAMYAGHYIFGCTLPNAVVEGKGPLKLIITIDGNEFTYFIRK